MSSIEPMSTYEYEAFYGWGEMPERFWPKEIERLKQEFVAGKITQAEMEDELDDMMGISRLQGYNGTWKRSTAISAV